MTDDALMQNSQLDGNTFFWESGPTGVLLIHGFTATTAEVRLLGQYLYERGYTVLGPLLPGHGTTPEDINSCRWQDWTGAVEQAYGQLAAKCSRVFVCGESMGALLTLYLASERPEIAGVVVYSPALLVAFPLRMFLARLLAPFIPYTKKPVGPPNITDTRWKGYTVDPLHAVVELNQLQIAVRSRLSLIHQPVLAIEGRLDRTIDLKSGDVLISTVSSTAKELRWLDQSTHCLLLDKEWEQAAAWTLGLIKQHTSA